MDTLVRLLAQGEDHFGSGGHNTPEFNAFFSRFKKRVRLDLQKIGGKDFVISKGHFYISGFFTVGIKKYYFSLSDVRWSIGEDYSQLLYRTVSSYDDYTGGMNQYVALQNDWQNELKLY